MPKSVGHRSTFDVNDVDLVLFEQTAKGVGAVRFGASTLAFGDQHGLQPGLPPIGTEDLQLIGE